MRRLVIADLRANAATWMWTLLCATVAAACGTGVLVAVSSALAVSTSAETTEGIEVVGANVVTYTVLAAVGMLGATTGLTLAMQSRQHALWVVLGVPRTRVRAVLLAQAGLVGAFGGVAGLPLAWIVAAVTLREWAGLDLAPAGLSPTPAGWEIPAGVGLAILSALWGGWGTARRAARVPEVAALAEADAPHARVGLLRPLLAAFLLLGAGGILVAVLTGDLDGPDDRAAGAMGGNLLLVTALLLVGGWTLRPLLHAWTALVPALDPAWHVARAACRARSARSITTVLPFALAASLLAVLVGGGRVLGDDVSFAELGILLGWVLVVAWCGGVAVIALTGAERGRDAALLVAAGADDATITRAAVYEGAIYAGTAALFGLGALVWSVMTGALAAGVDVGDALARAPWLPLGIVCAGALLTACAVVLVPAHRAGRTSVADALRT